MPSLSRWYYGQEYAYFCYGDCLQEPILRQEMESELAEALIPLVQDCIDLDVFERQGFQISAGVMSANATVGKDQVTYVLHYPIRMSREELDLTIDRFAVDIDVPLGKLYDLVLLQMVISQFSNTNKH